MRTLDAVADRLRLPAARRRGEVRLTGVAQAASSVRPGDLYVARGGRRAHGADFSAAAAGAGAAAILTDPPGRVAAEATGLPVLVHGDVPGIIGPLSSWIYGDPSTRLAVLGVTGTSGKTTTTYLLEAGLAAAGVTPALLGTVQTRIAGEVVPSAHTTPEAPDLQAILAVMAERGATHAAIEVSSHALALGRVDGTRFATASFLNLSPEHLDFHRDMDDYFAAKSLLFDGRAAAEVVNVDDAWGRRLARPGRISVSTQGADADWTAGPAADGPAAPRRGGGRFVARGPAGAPIDVQLALPGGFNISNALIALATLAAAGVDPRAAAPGFADVWVPGRLERIDAGAAFEAFVDYAHKPAALRAVLGVLRPAPPGRLIAVIGAGGDRDRAKRPLMGATAARLADVVIITDDNPRSEDPAAIRAEVEAGARAVTGNAVLSIAGRAEAIQAAVDRARAGDVVVVAGKGHEQGQEIAGEIRPFDDRVVLRAAIRAAGGTSGATAAGQP